MLAVGGEDGKGKKAGKKRTRKESQEGNVEEEKKVAGVSDKTMVLTQSDIAADGGEVG
jgi:hypothetical protein